VAATSPGRGTHPRADRTPGLPEQRGPRPDSGTERAPGFCCRFEDRLAGRRLELSEPLARIAVHEPAQLPAAWAAIEAARREGHWVALLLDYELGEWLDPGQAPRANQDPAADALPPTPDPLPRLTALVCARGTWRAIPATQPEAPGTQGPAPGARPGAPGIPGPDETGAQPEAPGIPGPDETGAGAAPPFHPWPGIDRGRHAAAIETIRAAIARGDYYQINYTLPLRLDWPAGLDPRRVYEHLAAQHPVAHAACIQDGDRWVLSFSPELFVERNGPRLRVRPMKGTAPRHADPVLDRQSADELRASAKNRAENLMIVDLLRNDLGRIAVPGSVRVPALFSLEAYPSVWTLTSTVEAEAPGVPLAEVLRALFPCGSVTGAPKIAAMRAIRTLEGRRRGIYCGSVGWLAPDGDFSLNVAIRTIEVRAGAAQFGVGGGIVHDSRATNEWQECGWKARLVDPDMCWCAAGDGPPASEGAVCAAGSAVSAAGDAVSAAGGAVSAASSAVSAAGGAVSAAESDACADLADLRRLAPSLIETMRLDAGRIALWPWHRARLLASAAALGYRLDAATLEAWLDAQLAGLPARGAGPAAHGRVLPGTDRGPAQAQLPGPMRLRLLLAADGRLSLEAAPLPATPEPVRIALATEALGPGAVLDADALFLRHKTTHRPAYAGAQSWLQAHPDLFDLIYGNAAGELCEGSRTTVYVRDAAGTWLTPPLACGLLPGVQRQALLDRGAVREARIRLADLRSAPAVRVSNALRGWLDAVWVEAA
jgi:para-aminobenzoate synthetase component 1